jgi:MFS family permease
MVIELPCCLGLVYVKPGHQFGLATITFGVLATCIAACKSYGSLIAIRFLLGLSEAFVQVGFVYLSLWYRHDEIALRSALVSSAPAQQIRPLSTVAGANGYLQFYVSGPLAGAASGLIAYGVAHNLDNAHGIADWRWLFM